MNPPSRIDLLVASRRTTALPGGLARYQEHLVGELSARHGLRIAACAAESEGLVSPAHELNLRLPEVREPRRAWMSCASRPLLHGFLERWIIHTYRPVIEVAAALRPRAVHFVGTGWDFFGFAMAALARRCAAPLTIWPAVHPGQWGDDRIDLRLYRHAAAVFCQSRHESCHLAAKGLPADRHIVSGLPPMCANDGNGAALRERLGITGRTAVLFLGRREPEKGYDNLLRAWSTVWKKHPDTVLLLAGPGESLPPREALPSEAFRDLEVPDEQEKSDAFAACDIFCMPSSHEAFGIVYAEAWSFGKPVVCGTAPASREWIADGITGLWTDGQPADIADKLLRLIENPENRFAMGRAGAEFQRSTLTWDAVSALHLEAFGRGSENHD